MRKILPLLLSCFYALSPTQAQINDALKNTARSPRPHSEITQSEDIKNPFPLPMLTLDSDNSIEPQRLEDLDLPPDFAAELRRVDPAAFDNDLEYSAAVSPRTYYFHGIDHDFRPAKRPQNNGYFRKILGTTAEGKTVAQDFYQHGGLPQTSPFILTPGHETDFGPASNSSRALWYGRDGSVQSVAEYADGERQGWSSMYRRDRLILRARTGADGKNPDLLFFDQEERPMIFSSHDGRETFYYPDGKPMLTFLRQENGELTARAWDEKGNTITLDRIDRRALRMAARQEDIIDMVNSP